MESLISTKEKYLLEASLDVLHQESLSWINTVCFWEDENNFFQDLLNNKLFQNTTLKDQRNISKLIDNVIGKNLATFKKEISVHEKNLETLLRTKSDAGDFRQRHKTLTKEYVAFEEQMKQFKTAVFELLKLVNMNFFNGNETLNTIYERRAVRKYKSEAIGRMHIEQIITAGRMAPSEMNEQPWRFYVITNKEKIKSYSSQITKVAESLFQLSLKEYSNEDDPIFHGAPVVIIITANRGTEWAAMAVGMCAQNMMLAAKSLGYDSCPIGMAKAIEKTDIHKDMNIPPEEEVHIGIAMGYGDEMPAVHKIKSDQITFLD